MGRTLLAPLVVLLLAAPARGLASESATDANVVEHWYSVEIGGTPAGWSLSREIRHGDRLTTVSISHLRFQRGGTEQTLDLESRFVETSDGRPLGAWARQGLAREPLETTWEFADGGVWVETAHGAETRRQRMPRPPGDWLTPGRLRTRLRALIEAGEERFILASLDPQLGLETIETEWRLESRESGEAGTGPAPASYRFRLSQSFAPRLETVVEVDGEGLILRSTTEFLGLEMTEALASRDRALGGVGAPELLLETFVYPDRPIAAPRRARRALYEISAMDGTLEVPPSAGSQRVLSATADAVRVLVEVGSSPRLEGGDTLVDAEYLRSSTFVDHSDPAVRRLLATVPGAGETPAARAELLRAFVAGHVEEKNLDSILATASDVAEGRSGDCTEHSVLLAALLRADGIASRLVTGLVYVDELAGARRFFGYHMWTQAHIEGRWIDLDASFPTPFDATHIALGTTALADDGGAAGGLAKLASSVGRIRIRVIEVE